MKCLMIDAERQGYTPSQVKATMTVKELREFLEDYDDDMKVFMAHDNGYTYGGVSTIHLEEWEDDWPEEDD